MTVEDVQITPLIPEETIGTPNLDKLLMTTEEELEMKENIQKYENISIFVRAWWRQSHTVCGLHQCRV